MGTDGHYADHIAVDYTSRMFGCRIRVVELNNDHIFGSNLEHELITVGYLRDMHHYVSLRYVAIYMNDILYVAKQCGLFIRPQFYITFHINICRDATNARNEPLKPGTFVAVNLASQSRSSKNSRWAIYMAEVRDLLVYFLIILKFCFRYWC